ncbi:MULTISPECIES: sporulation histidine kinase inhibitor Sda [Bacillaceae]|uniref:Sporulation protein n=1 Tax=Domibacillus aminovorans TaxID=29332 RepID=A0A177KQJ3_9BACI|nr:MULTISPECIES: sporulation histidine kinase inhibitor Sda [Bacillaceae]OAH54801.1 sporulation protein [Domibacillus aminovorans]OAH63176.1 sporulation protein [Domibacillus aminovorans]
MKEKSDKFIISAYNRAVELQLEEEFIRILENELERRGIKYRFYCAQRM